MNQYDFYPPSPDDRLFVILCRAALVAILLVLIGVFTSG